MNMYSYRKTDRGDSKLKVTCTCPDIVRQLSDNMIVMTNLANADHQIGLRNLG